jgi:hypothetical protein
MSEVVSWRPLTAEPRVHLRPFNMGFVVDKVALEQIFFQYGSFPL